MGYMNGIMLLFELAGTVAFAASGAMVAIRKNMDLFGICVLGVVTAVGGGMTRDIILGRIPNALVSPAYTIAAALTSVLLFLAMYCHRGSWKEGYRRLWEKAMLLADAVGLGIFTVMGVNAGIESGYPDKVFLLVFLGTVTGVGGGLLRDMMAGDPPYILVRHIYACASIAGALSYIGLRAHWGQLPALLIAPALVVTIRMLAAHYRWNLPHLTQQ